MIDDLKPLLQDLPDPAPPSSITATVMARIAREADRRMEDQVTAPVRRASEVGAWLYACTGVALVLLACAYGWFSTESIPDLTSARIGVGRPPLMPSLGPFSALLGFGLLVYLAGLFAPLRSDRR